MLTHLFFFLFHSFGFDVHCINVGREMVKLVTKLKPFASSLTAEHVNLRLAGIQGFNHLVNRFGLSAVFSAPLLHDGGKLASLVGGNGHQLRLVIPYQVLMRIANGESRCNAVGFIPYYPAMPLVGPSLHVSFTFQQKFINRPHENAMHIGSAGEHFFVQQFEDVYCSRRFLIQTPVLSRPHFSQAAFQFWPWRIYQKHLVFQQPQFLFITHCRVSYYSKSFQQSRNDFGVKGKIPQTWHVCTSCRVQDLAHWCLVKVFGKPLQNSQISLPIL